MSAAVITASGVAKSFGTTSVLSDITVDFPAGITGLLGSNGAGKTTLLSLVLGFEPRDGGNLTVLGHDPQTAAPRFVPGSVIRLNIIICHPMCKLPILFGIWLSCTAFPSRQVLNEPAMRCGWSGLVKNVSARLARCRPASANE